VYAAPATSGRKISPASPSRPAADQDFDQFPVPTSEFGLNPPFILRAGFALRALLKNNPKALFSFAEFGRCIGDRLINRHQAKQKA
jgi:hypothetical protein